MAFFNLKSFSYTFLLISTYFIHPFSADAKNIKAPQLNQHKAIAPAELTKKKTWNFIVYMAANNNLHSYAIRNINQMMSIGSNEHINIIAQIDGLQNNKIKRHYVKKNELVTLGENDGINILPSGTPESLYNLVDWTIKNFPADHQAIVLWNHGSGIKDPSMWGRELMRNRDEYFTYNEQTGKLILQRSLIADNDILSDFLDEETQTLKERGIAFNEANRAYITNKELRETLEKIQQQTLGGKKIDLVCFDACHMGMAELAFKMQKTVKFMTGSAEVEPGAGYNYATFLKNCSQKHTTPENFTKEVVNAYGKEYNNIYTELTQVGINLELFGQTEPIWTLFKENLLACIDINNQRKSFSDLLKNIRNSAETTTEYSDPDYIDIQPLLTSIINLNIQPNDFNANDKVKIATLKDTAGKLLEKIQNSITAKSCGADLPQASGLAFYFPKRYIHSSYSKTSFDSNIAWSSFLKKYIDKTRSTPVKLVTR